MQATHVLLGKAVVAVALALWAAPGSAATSSALDPFTARSGAPRAPEQKAVLFEHADLSFRILPAQRAIEGDARLTFRARAPLTRLVVDLDRNYTVDAVTVDGRDLDRSTWSNPHGRMTVALPKQIETGERVLLRVRYAGQPHVAERAPWDGGFVWGTAPDGEPWVASAVEGEGCDLLWPCIDHPRGEPLLVDEHITVPVPLVAPGNGVAMGMDEHDGWRTYHWRARSPDTYAITLNAGPFELLSAEYRSRFGNVIPLRFWYLRGHAEQARALFAQFPQMLDFFEARIGPYPFGDEKMGVVETPYLGMEHQTINAYGNGFRLTQYGYDWLLQHEFAHEWFGNQLTNDGWDHMWLHEGFASYMQPLYLQWLRGDREYDAWLLDQRKTLANRVPIVSGRAMDESDVYNAETGPGNDIYYKGSLLLHTLRQLIGDEAFFAATRELVYGTGDPRPGNFQPRYADTADFVAAVNRATGRDYGWFFDTYVYSAALPELRATRDAGGLSLAWRTEGDKPFPMPVEVRVDGRDVRVPMREGHGYVRLAPRALYTIDPHSRVLRARDYIDAYQADARARAKAEAAKQAQARDAEGDGDHEH